MNYICESYNAKNSRGLYERIDKFLKRKDFLQLSSRPLVPDEEPDYFHSSSGAIILSFSGPIAPVDETSLGRGTGIHLATAFIEKSTKVLEDLLGQFPQFKSNNDREIIDTIDK